MSALQAKIDSLEAEIDELNAERKATTDNATRREMLNAINLARQQLLNTQQLLLQQQQQQQQGGKFYIHNSTVCVLVCGVGECFSSCYKLVY